ncbi:prohibitin family protein [Shumkonia mesophila]|uniref:prohibitin family protein n=1 Tax=Shumkonia mesophila TaxID=2838854 RepID=UPI0029350C86|nr:prohibitin family protein [Shumkonia mesophila]
MTEPPRVRFRQWRRRHAMGIYALQLSVLAALIVAVPFSLIEIPAGHVGVLWQRFFGGTVTDDSYSEGLRVIFPWDHITLYDARLQNSARYYDTISSNGLSMEVDIAVRFRINREAVGALHKLVGPRYDEVLVYPEIGSYARDYISRYTPEQLYSANRAFIQAQILKRMRADGGASLLRGQDVGEKLVEVEDVLIRSVRLPTRVEDAIERKVEQQQAVLEYDFRIARETKEAERKRIEAMGVRDFQEAVAGQITDEYLRLRGIEATMALSTARNSKIIIVGGGEGLPVIFNPPGDMKAPGVLPVDPAQAGGEAAPEGAPADPFGRPSRIP